MKIINRLKITSFLNFNLKLIVLSSLLFSQLFLSEIFLYQNDPDTPSINIAKADASDTWYDASYLYRKEITINSAKVPNTDQTNFPVLISLTDTALRTVANGGKVTNANGYDIIFANQAGNAKLDHEIESYDAATGTIVMWVKIPVLSHLINTVIYMYYGNTNISTTQENKTGVWDSSFKMVQHMNQDPSGAGAQMKDSTSNTNNGTSSGMVTGDGVDGKINKALNFDGSDNYIDTGTMGALSSNLSLLSFSTWFKTSSTGIEALAGTLNTNATESYFKIVLNASPFSGNNVQGAILFQVRSSNGNFSGGVSSDTGVEDGNWHHIVVTLDKANAAATITIDGVAKTVVYGASNTGTTWVAWSRNLFIGADNEGSALYPFNGTIDEVHISQGILRSLDWTKTEYNNQSNSAPGAGNFILLLGTEESYATSYALATPPLSSGLVNAPSANFTVTPNGIYTGTITITPSGGGLSDVITKTFANSSTPQTFTITPTIAGTVTLAMSNSGSLTNPSPATYNAISISASPSGIIQGSTDNTINITGTNTSWTAGTPGVPTFTLSGGTNASITNQTVIDPTHATLTINAGSTAGNLTITDPSTGATTIVAVVPSTANQITSFNLTVPAATGIINDTTYTVYLTVPYGTNVTSLTPTITTSTGATISPTSGTSHNFTFPATYTVIAQDGATTQDYTVTVNVSPSTAGGFIAPTQPIIPIQDNRIDISNLPPDIIQIAISRTPDFKDVSWEAFSNEEIKQLDNCPDKLYIKFRNKSGAVSDVIIYVPKTNNDTNISNLKDGDIVKTINNPDVYIIKIKNNKQYKRLILSPQVFQSYGHLKWTNIKIISQEELDQYMTSNLVKETTDTIIYQLFPNGDAGERRVFDISKPYDTDSVYEINKVDRDSYRLLT